MHQVRPSQSMPMRRFALGRSARRVAARGYNVLIANTKGGGHAFIGYHLTLALLRQGHRVTILNDGSQAKLAGKAPYQQYSQLEAQGARIVWGDPSAEEAIPDGEFQVVYDNNGKDMGGCKALIDHFQGRVQHYVFVASAGAYEANPDEPMHVEGDKRKLGAGHVAVEAYLEQQGLPFTVVHPLYIYGPHTNKDCEQWFIDRIARGRPVPLPGDGSTLTSLTHVEDIASLMAAVPGRQEAVRQHFNACSDRCITFNGIAKALAQSLGTEAQLAYYDPKALKLGKGEGVPFRTVHFFASVTKAKHLLGWQPRHSFLEDVNERVEEYYQLGREQVDVDFSGDQRILAAIGYQGHTPHARGGATSGYEAGRQQRNHVTQRSSGGLLGF